MNIPHWLTWLLVIVSILALMVVMAKVWPVGADYYYHRYPLAQSFLAGETRLYDGRGPHFQLAPWTLLIFIPLSLLSIQAGQAALNVLSLVAMAVSLYLLRDEKPIPRYALILSLANLHTFDLLIRGGKLDAFVLLGIVLASRAIRDQRPWLLSLAFWLISMKPPNALLAVLLFLYAIRKWSLLRWAQTFSLPVLSILVSGFFIGFDWPLRYINRLVGYPSGFTHLQISLWRGVAQLGLPLWPVAILAVLALIGLVVLVRRVGLNLWSLSIALATNLVFTFYSIGNHYVLLVPVFVFVACRDWKLALPAYLMTWTPTLRLIWGYDISSIDIIYPVTLLVASWLVGLQGAPSAEEPTVAVA